MTILIAALAALTANGYPLPQAPDLVGYQTQPPAKSDPFAVKLAEAGKLEKAGKFAEAEKLYRQILAVAASKSRETLEADALHGLALVFDDYDKDADALVFVDREIPLRERIGPPRALGDALHLAGYILHRLGRGDKSVELYARALTIREKLGNQVDIAQSLNNIGNVYKSLGQFDKALDFHCRALVIRKKLGNQEDIAQSLYNIGNVYKSLSQLDRALDFHSRALVIGQKLGNQRDIAQCLYKIGTIYQSLGQFNKALDFHSRALAIRQKLGNQEDIAQSLNNIGIVYDELDQFDRALDFHSRALVVRQKLGNQGDIAWSLRNIGTVYDELGQFDRALDFHSRALVIRQRLGNQEDIAQSLSNIGNVYRSLGQFDKALDPLGRALEIREELGNPENIANSLDDHGLVYYYLGQFERALDFFARSMSAYEKLGKQKAFAESLCNSGAVYEDLGQYDKALSCYARSLAIFEKVGNPTEISFALDCIGSVYGFLGQFKNELDYKTRALNMRYKLSSPVTIAYSLNNVGTAYESIGQFEKALGFYTRSLAIFEKIGNPLLVASGLCNIGNAYYCLDQFDKAVDFHSRSLAIREKLGNQNDIADNLNSLGRDYDSLDEEGRALDLYKRSLAIKEKLGNKLNIAMGLENIGGTYDSLRQFERAAASYSRAIELYEDVCKQVGNPSDLAEFASANQSDLAARCASLRLKQGNPGEALVMVERGRASALARQVAFGQANLGAIFSAEDAKALKEAEQRVLTASAAFRSVQKSLETVPSAGKPALEKAEAVKKKVLDAATQNYELVRDGIYARNPKFKQISGASPPTIDQLLGLGKKNPDTLYVEYSLLDDDLTIYAIAGASGLKTYEQKVKKKDLDSAVKAFTDSVAGDAGKEQAAAKALFAMILGPLEKDGLLAASLPSPGTCGSRTSRQTLPLPPPGAGGEIQTSSLEERELETWSDSASRPTLPLPPSGGEFKHLVFVADGSLLEVPFAALMDGQGKRLIETHTVSTSVSLGVLTWDTTPRDPTENLLVIADPTGDGGQKITSPTRGGFAPLPGARIEGKGIVDQVPGSTALIGSEAKEATVKADAPKYAILHFATHGSLNSTREMLSSLVLAPEDPIKNPLDDGFLEAQEVVGLPLSAQLAVLSACNTAEGTLKGGDGLMGLAWAFRAAGVPAIVASKWEVDDEATRRIMVRFYQELLKPGTRKDDALQTAILAEMVVQEKEHPTRAESVTGSKPSGKRSNAYYWAAFQLIGDPSPLKPLPKK